MKKRITQKVLATLTVACLMISGVFAQTHNGSAIPAAGSTWTAYAPTTATGAFPGSIGAEAATYITQGTTIPLWVRPDPYFHPNYDPTAASPVYTTTNGFTWTWTVPAALTYSQATFAAANSNDNYITLTAQSGATLTPVGPYTISVVENAPAAYGSCAGAAQDITVNVVAAPSFALTSGADATYSLCEGNVGLPTAINTTISGGWQNYRLAWNLTITTLDAGGNIEYYYTDQAGAGQSPAATPVYAVNHTTDETTNPFQAVAAATTTHNIMTVPSFLVIDNNGVTAGGDAITRYTYTLVSINDQASRYGNFITLVGDDTDAAAFTYYNATAAADQVVVTVYPAPVTGPIYHINNTWAQ